MVSGQSASGRFGAWGGMLSITLLTLVTFILWLALPAVMASKPVLINLSTNATLRLYGIPLVNKSVRQGAFRILGHSKARVFLAVPPGVNVERTKVADTLTAMGEAGISSVSICVQTK